MAEFLVGKQQRPPNDFYEITFGDLHMEGKIWRSF